MLRNRRLSLHHPVKLYIAAFEAACKGIWLYTLLDGILLHSMQYYTGTPIPAPS